MFNNDPDPGNIIYLMGPKKLIQQLVMPSTNKPFAASQTTINIFPEDYHLSHYISTVVIREPRNVMSLG